VSEVDTIETPSPQLITTESEVFTEIKEEAMEEDELPEMNIL